MNQKELFNNYDFTGRTVASNRRSGCALRRDGGVPGQLRRECRAFSIASLTKPIP
jgi:hypothetical protein